MGFTVTNYPYSVTFLCVLTEHARGSDHVIAVEHAEKLHAQWAISSLHVIAHGHTT